MKQNLIDFNSIPFEEFNNGLYTGKQARIYFNNGYGASIVRHQYSYGGSEGLYEVAVLRDNQIVYDTTITNDVIGYCDEEKVSEILLQIQQLQS